MTKHAFHLAQLNIARARGAIDDPVMSGFVSRLDEINAVADGAPGFVWRLQDAEGNATSIRPFEDDRILVNLSVWESAEAFVSYVYASPHGAMVRAGHTWFERSSQAQIVLWWIPAGERPTLDEALRRLERLRTHGPGPGAFTIDARFAPSQEGTLSQD